MFNVIETRRRVADSGTYTLRAPSLSDWYVEEWRWDRDHDLRGTCWQSCFRNTKSLAYRDRMKGDNVWPKLLNKTRGFRLTRSNYIERSSWKYSEIEVTRRLNTMSCGPQLLLGGKFLWITYLWLFLCNFSDNVLIDHYWTKWFALQWDKMLWSLFCSKYRS